MGWWNDLFSKKDKCEETEYNPEFNECYIPPKKDISEPVVSFVECVKNNPERFKIRNDEILDRKTQKKFKIHQGYSGYIGDGKYLYHYNSRENTNWMNEDEMEYAYLQLEVIQKQKIKNFKDKQRQKYIDIYVTKQNDQ